MIFKPNPPYIKALNCFSDKNPPYYKKRFEKLKKDILTNPKKRIQSRLHFIWVCDKGHEFVKTFKEMILIDPTCPVCKPYSPSYKLFVRFKEKFNNKYINAWKKFENLSSNNIYSEFKQLRNLRNDIFRLKDMVKILRFFNKNS